MGKADVQKRRRKAARELVGKAYEREMSAALRDLEAHFARWHAGTISCFELDEQVHVYHDGIARDLWKKYRLHPEMLVPGLVADGIVSEAEVPGELTLQIRDAIRAEKEFRKRQSERPDEALTPEG